MRPACVLLVVGMLATSCGWLERRKAREELAQQDAAFEEIISRLELPVSSIQGDPVQQLTRVVVTRTAIHVDNSPLIDSHSSSWNDYWEYNRPKDVLFSRENADTIGKGVVDKGGSRILEGLRKALEETYRLERDSSSRINASPTGAVNIYLDGRIPYHGVVRVLYTIGQARYERINGIVLVGEEHRSLTLNQPKMSPGPNHGIAQCIEPAVAVSSKEWAVKPTTIEGGGVVAGGWKMLDRIDDTFVGVPRAFGAGALQTHLKKIVGDVGPCRTAMIGSDANSSWQDVVGTIAALKEVAPFKWISLHSGSRFN